MTSFPKLAERFIAYAKVDTRSDASSTTVPTTYSQVAFTKQLATELESIGLQDVFYNEANGFLTATLPSSVDFPVPVIGFIAHVDTADFHAENIQPLVHENYDGNDVVLNEALQIVLSATEFPNLKNYIGQTLITTDGTTLLGSDDKSGIAEIVTAMETLIQNPTIPHGEIRIAFGPDEEIGTGADRFDAEGFNAAFAYTLDSGRVGHMEYETFNAAQAELTIDGSSVHPGTAYKRMVNALSVAAQFACALPQDEVPELTKASTCSPVNRAPSTKSKQPISSATTTKRTSQRANGTSPNWWTASMPHSRFRASTANFTTSITTWATSSPKT